MRHLRKGKKLGRVSKQRKALLRSLAVALIREGKIKTTLTKAKVLRPYIEKIITKAKHGGMAVTRELRRGFDDKSVKNLIEKWGPLFSQREGGYTRVTKLISRVSDASPVAFIEFVEVSSGAKGGDGKSKKTGAKNKLKVKNTK